MEDPSVQIQKAQIRQTQIQKAIQNEYHSIRFPLRELKFDAPAGWVAVFAHLQRLWGCVQQHRRLRRCNYAWRVF